MSNQYAQRNIMELDRPGGHYSRHVDAMTGESLHDKSDIAAELAHRDAKIKELEQQNTALLAHVERLQQYGSKIMKSMDQKQAIQTAEEFKDALRSEPSASLAWRDAKVAYEAVYTATVIMNSVEASEFLVGLRYHAGESSNE